MAKKERLDVLVVSKGLLDSREKAKRSIMAGLIKVNNEIIDKPGTQVLIDADIKLKGNLCPYVSRGGLKLVKAVQEFSIDLNDKIILDIGASTGGFTDCALQHGAKEVYAIDVGYGQLAWKLRQDERVHVLERTNFRYLEKKDLKFSSPDFAIIDVSFISLKTILSHLLIILEEKSQIVALVKPQFEAGREHVGKKGVIRDAKVHSDTLKKMTQFVLKNGYDLVGLTYSPIKGGEGNIEFLMYLENISVNKEFDEYKELIESVVENAHKI